MCVNSPASGLGESLAKLSPHRLLGLPSFIDPILHPNSKYNRPPEPKEEAAPVVTRVFTPEGEVTPSSKLTPISNAGDPDQIMRKRAMQSLVGPQLKIGGY